MDAIVHGAIAIGALGVFALMVPESAGLPVPSEVTLLLAGVAVGQGRMSWWAAIGAATLGNVVGSLVLYRLGRRSALRRRDGRIERALARCDRLFGRYGDLAVFVGRLLPLARSFVSWPAGRAGVPVPRFLALTIAGCTIWAAAFVAAGALAGDGYAAIGGAVRDVTIGMAAAALAAALVHRVRRVRRRQPRCSSGT
jgi:membrane protein DedA with SNARE-associated domain